MSFTILGTTARRALRRAARRARHRPAPATAATPRTPSSRRWSGFAEVARRRRRAPAPTDDFRSSACGRCCMANVEREGIGATADEPAASRRPRAGRSADQDPGRPSRSGQPASGPRAADPAAPPRRRGRRRAGLSGVSLASTDSIPGDAALPGQALHRAGPAGPRRLRRQAAASCYLEFARAAAWSRPEGRARPTSADARWPTWTTRPRAGVALLTGAAVGRGPASACDSSRAFVEQPAARTSTGWRRSARLSAVALSLGLLDRSQVGCGTSKPALAGSWPRRS